MSFFRKLVDKFSSAPKIDWDELEETLIAADLGIKLTTEIVEDLSDASRKISADDLAEHCRNRIRKILEKDGGDPDPLTPRADGKPTVVLIAGVNGVGKTTSTAKLGHHLKGQGHGVILAAADTFRAAAIEQLQAWGTRLDITVTASEYGADPAAVCYDAYQAAVSANAAFLLCDTAGRLHNRHNLMEELAKTNRMLGRQDPSAPHETLLVVDATTGSNALNQAREFSKILDLTGIIVTKLDGSGKGGAVVAIRHELGLPVRYIGTGEEPEKLELFNAEKFVAEIL